jgi:hypothetical protein
LLFLYLLSFVLFCAALLSLLRVSPIDIVHDCSALLLRLKPNKKPSLKQQIKRSVKEHRIRGIRKVLIESKNVLVLTHRTDRLRWYISVSVLLAVAGMLIGAAFGNVFLMPVLGAGLALLPWLSILLSASSMQRQLNEELETTLSMITTSYLRSDNIIESVRENIGSIHYPIRDVFEKFLVQADLISSDVTQLLEEMKNSLDNIVFQDWVDQIILCRQNRTLKSTLQPIVARLSDIREVTGDLDNLMYDKIKEFVQLAFLNVFNFPLIYLMYREWFFFLKDRLDGQILTAAVFVLVFIALIGGTMVMQPVEERARS